jgi:UDP-N-acetylmuramoyl-tripeptide--D-alanyl-D-alanine ligase
MNVMEMSLSQLTSCMPDAVVTEDATFTQVITDSRKAGSKDSLFVALRGERFDAHDFLSEVVEQGVAGVMVEKLPPDLKVPAIVVPDTRLALGQLGRYWRQQCDLPLIAVTGSNGKTTVKEMIASILAAEFGPGHYLATQGNFNNDIGVPLTLLRLQASHQAAVIELGMNHPGEIAVLANMAQAKVALVNNAQREHLEFMANVDAVAQENGAVISALPADGVAVFPADAAHTELWRDLALSSEQGKGRKILTFGFTADADVTCQYQNKGMGSDLQVKLGAQYFPLHLNVAGEHNVRNALAAIACTHALGINIPSIVRGLELFTSVQGRLQCKSGRQGAKVIDDTYNANPDSVRAAIDVLAQAPSPRILILGDMGEVGHQGQQFHEEIGQYARSRQIDCLLTLGQLASYSTQAFGVSASHYENIDALYAAIDRIVNTVNAVSTTNAAPTTSTPTILVKGSRFMKMERVVQHLINQTGQSELAASTSQGFH